MLKSIIKWLVKFLKKFDTDESTSDTGNNESNTRYGNSYKLRNNQITGNYFRTTEQTEKPDVN